MENVTSEQVGSILMRLRTRLNDLLRSGVMTPDGFGMYQQTILQLHQEFERRRQGSMAAAEDFRKKAAQAEAEANAFAAAGSLIFAIVNGYIELEEKRLREQQERQAEKAESLPAILAEDAEPKVKKGKRQKP